MSYARSRLWLGMSGVGLIVLLSLGCLLTKVPLEFLSLDESWSGSDLAATVMVFCLLTTVMVPLDLLGGYFLPNRIGNNTVCFKSFLIGWVRGVATQGAFFVCASLFILLLGRWYGALGASVGVGLLCLFLVAFQLKLGRLAGSLGQHTELSTADQDRLVAATRLTSAYGWEPRDLVLLTHQDPGFTGGVVGLPGREKIVLPAGILNRLTSDELAATIARRLEATDDGSRSRGLLVAFGWVLLGFNLSATLPGAGVTSVAALAMTCLGFTLWTFLGLLTLPSLSRQASFAIDSRVVDRGVSTESLTRSVSKFDQLQDDEPERARMIETIFHPVPSVSRRRGQANKATPIAWHAARMTLFLSWACMGTLVRAVHCNVGRPELWVMYPTD
jgi:hypothetical protein